MPGKDTIPVISTRNLAIGYSSKKSTTSIASNISIELQSGELIGIIGGNGIGKSTLLKTLTKVQPPLSGEIYIKNKLLEQYTANSLAKTIRVVLTEPLASKNLSVFELVALGRQPYTNWIGNLTPSDISITNKALALVGIENLKSKICLELSDGQLQKVMIARALAQDTDIVVLDEPTAHLDLYYKAYTLKLLKNLTKTTGKTIVFSSHEIDLAIQLCDALIVMMPDSIIIDTPCNHIKKGTFNALFPKDLIAFDAATGSFKVKK